MRAFLRLAYRISDRLKEALLVLWLSLPVGFLYTATRSVPVIASLTTYPPRINKSWLAIETLLRQSVRPERLVLVLNTEEFPSKKLPRRIARQTRRGLEILWAHRNGRSHDKLIPVRTAFPQATIVTFDDDKFFPRDLLEKLTEASDQSPGKVIGARGWEVRRTEEDDDDIHFGEGWTRATPHSSGPHLFLPGGNGCVYPYDSLHALVDNLDEALRVTPTADDVWFWGALQKNSGQMVCLGLPPHRPVSALKAGPALSALGESENERQFQDALDFFCIRDRVHQHSLKAAGADG
jgi:hypothetical protein